MCFFVENEDEKWKVFFCLNGRYHDCGWWDPNNFIVLFRIPAFVWEIVEKSMKNFLWEGMDRREVLPLG